MLKWHGQYAMTVDHYENRWTHYSGPLWDYCWDAGRKHECGDDLQFLQHVKDKKNTYFSMVDWDTPLPPKDYDTYVITQLGESENVEWIDRVREYPGRKIIITSQYSGTFGSKVVKKRQPKTKTTYFHMEHLHWYTQEKCFSYGGSKPLKDRQCDHACLNGRADWHKEETLLALAKHFDRENLQYTWREEPYNPNYIPNHFRFWRHSVPIPRRVGGHTWSTMNTLYRECKLHWVTESMFTSHDNRLQAYLTEKTIKPIASRCAFVLIGQRLSYERLRNLGFQTFEDHFGVDWDTKQDFDRMWSILEFIRSFDYDLNLQDQVDYNYDYFHHDFFPKIRGRNRLVKEQILEHING